MPQAVVATETDSCPQGSEHTPLLRKRHTIAMLGCTWLWRRRATFSVATTIASTTVPTNSRPGVVSEVLSPALAVKKVLAVATAISQLAVVGIAGPGDPLANPERTFATFRKLLGQAPDFKLCLSINELVLPDLVNALCAHKVSHVTITINCIDPAVGAEIYPWISRKKRRIEGPEGAWILIERQQKGLEMPADAASWSGSTRW